MDFLFAVQPMCQVRDLLSDALYIYIYIQAETLLRSLERAATCIDLHVNAHKTEYMCFNQAGDISTI